MKRWLKIVIVVIVILGIMQLFHPAKNFTKAEPTADVATKYEVPMNVLMILYTACYNCHSNYTKYPWYYRAEPVGWWMAYHINKAKRQVNFSEFATYSPKEATKKFHEIYEVTDEKTMPITSYLWMHPEAHLTRDQYKKVADWAQKMPRQLQASEDSAR
jgi:hypothetical protein